ncbi:MAG: acyl-CoA dehydrogenase [Candidatus Entotheonella factor]|uniref:Acyl-CoA dehydrogenase n=1 Tax=Entotheonella factor TaxID=1429438 RepID=W4L5E9_ENTF1|nr:acyl-CoA dehydrogenase family protein [Candidatus Entotheonella palauensis]ETW93298.1 MAG: acyl-CoA dehydrogenase [Candidatus Entotheonella factor]
MGCKNHLRLPITASGNPYHHAGIIDELKQQAKSQGLWNLFLPDDRFGAGLNNLEYAPLCEIMGRSAMAAQVFNCNAPDTGNMEILAEFATPEQQDQWLTPLLNGDIRSCFSMTEPHTASSDPTNLQTRAVRDGDEYVITGRKWFTSNAMHPNCKIAIAMVVTDPEAARHQRATMILVPMDAPGFNILRSLPVFDHHGEGGHAEVLYDDVRVPVTNRLGEEGSGFAIAQARLGPGRIHHCMRSIGGAERAFELMCERANSRYAFGSKLIEKQTIQNWIAESRMQIDAARLMTLYTAWKMDTIGKKEARQEISMIKILAARTYLDVLDRAIQVHGAMGVTNDTPLAHMWQHARTLRIVDGPDEVHLQTIARRESRKFTEAPI